MKKTHILSILCLSVMFLNAQNNSENKLQTLLKASQMMYYNSVAENDINTLREVAHIIPEVALVADLLANKTFDKNMQKHIDAQAAIKNKVGELTKNRGIEYVNVLCNLASDYSNIADRNNAGKLYEEALAVLKQETLSDSKTKWEYIIRFEQLFNKDFGSSYDDYVQLDEVISEVVNYLDLHQKDESDEVVRLCYWTTTASILQIPFEDYERFYTRGKNLAEKKHGTSQEVSISFLCGFYDALQSDNLNKAERTINDIINQAQKLYGEVNFLKLYALQRKSKLYSVKGDMQNEIATMEQCVAMALKLFDEQNYNVLNLKRALADVYLNTGKGNAAKAGKLIEEIVEQTKKNDGEISSRYLEALEYQISYYRFTENVQAQRIALKTAHETAKEFAKKDKHTAGILLNRISQYYAYDEALAVLDDAITMLKNMPKGEIEYANSLLNKGEIYIQKGMYDEAEKALKECMTIHKKTGNQRNYADVLTWLAFVYSQKKNHKEALKMEEQAYKIYKENNLEQTEDFVNLLINYGHELYRGNRQKQAVEKFEEAIKAAQKLDNQRLLGLCYTNYADFYYQQKNYQDALKNYNTAKTCYQNWGDYALLDYAAVLTNMSDVFIDLGQYNEAKNALTEARNIYERTTGKTSYDYFGATLRLLNFSKRTGNVFEAYNHFFDISIALKDLQTLTNNDITQMLDIASLVMPSIVQLLIEIQYQMVGGAGGGFKYVLANLTEKDKKEYIEQYGETAFNNFLAMPKQLDELESWLLDLQTELDNNKKYSKHISWTLGEYYYHIQPDSKKALKYYKEATDGIDKNTLEYATGLYQISNVYGTLDNYAQAIYYLEQSLNLRKKFSGNQNIELSFLLSAQSFNYFKVKNYQLSFKAAKERFELLQHNINSLFNTMNENDRWALSARYSTNARDIYTLLPVYPADEVTQTAYDATLYYKGLLLRSSNRIRESIFKSGNQNLKNNYERLVQLKTELQSLPTDMISALNAQQDTASYLKIKDLQTKIDSLDWALTQNSTAYRESQTITKWTDVLNKLKEGEVAIEFIVSYDSIDYQYGALILKKDFKAPIYIPLFKEKQLQDIIHYLAEKYKGKGRKDEDYNFCRELYLNTTIGNFKGKEIYELIWKPIAEKLLPTDTTIYYSPVGSLYNISFAALQNDERQSLFDLYNLRMLSSTANIVNIANNSSKIRDIKIYGGIMYDINKNVRDTAENWQYLRGTDLEAQKVNDLMKAKSISTKLYTELNATEEEFRKNNNNSPSLLYFNTHGYYVGEGMEKDEIYSTFYKRFTSNQLMPMKRGGLILSNANPVWHNEVERTDENNGILLAEEIADLDLSNTELAVLSACKTGVGSTSETEGVFGLQRGFKLSGVKTIVMSLWNVDNVSGTEFMEIFFTELLSGKERHEAFNIAQKTLREKYGNDPSKWAVFVMLD